MKKKYQVFSASRHPVQTSAKLSDGSTVDATVSSLDVQLVPVDDPHSGTLKVVATGAAVADAEALFAIGEQIEVSFSKGEI